MALFVIPFRHTSSKTKTAATLLVVLKMAFQATPLRLQRHVIHRRLIRNNNRQPVVTVFCRDLSSSVISRPTPPLLNDDSNHLLQHTTVRFGFGHQLLFSSPPSFAKDIKRSFSTSEMMHQKKKENVKEEQEQEENSKPLLPSNANILSTLPESYTPGQAMFLLQKKGGTYGSMISRKDFLSLCNASRHGYQRDSRVIYNALIDFRRCWNFRITQTRIAWKALDAMTKGFLPTHRERKGLDFIKAGLFAAKAFVDKRTGLYHVTESKDVQMLLDLIVSGLEKEAEENGMKYRTTTSSLLAEEENEEESAAKTIQTAVKRRQHPSKMAAQYLVSPNREVPKRFRKKRIRYCLRRIFGGIPQSKEARDKIVELPDDITQTVLEVFLSLVIRSSHPEHKMHRRMRYKYEKDLLVRDGPDSEMVNTFVSICCAVGGFDEAREIATLWGKSQNPTTGINYAEESLELLKFIEEMEATEKSAIAEEQDDAQVEESEEEQGTKDEEDVVEESSDKDPK